MIVKNEAHVIARCLASVRPFISSWVIVDTGSTDRTQEIVRDCLQDIPGALHERPWKNFGFNRTEGLQLARTYGKYSLIIDADEVLRAEDGFTLPELELDAYQLRTRLNDISYYRTQIVRSELPWRYEGVLHEYLELSQPFTQGRLEGLVNWPHPDGARSGDPDKYAKDAALLEAALLEEPTNSRYAYYLGQSYRDAGLRTQAIDAYRRRVALGGWVEETWSALFETARLLELTEHPQSEVVAAYLAAFEFRPSRAESLHALARYLRLQNRFELAYLFAKRATETPLPKDILFVDLSVYAWRAADELSIAAYYTGRHAEAIELTQALLDGHSLPEREHQRVRANQEYSLKALRDRS